MKFYHWPLEAMAAPTQMVYVEHAGLNCVVCIFSNHFKGL